MRLAVVTATIDLKRSEQCRFSWEVQSRGAYREYIVHQGPTHHAEQWHQQALPPRRVDVYYVPEILGVVPAFALGVQKALEDGADIICAFHDDLEIEQDGWDEDVIRLFQEHPQAGLCGFGGAKGLGSDDIYQTPYNPMQLARQGFRSNMRHAEAHGVRSLVVEPVACLDGFSQIGTRAFWRGESLHAENGEVWQPGKNLLQIMQEWGIIHHCFDSLLGCWAKRLEYQTWYLPIKCHHQGGVTAVGDARYHTWANHHARQTDRLEGIEEEGTGDQVFWLRSHKIGYENFRDVLPIRS